MIDKNINKESLDISKVEVQKVIVKILYESNNISLNQYNSIISKLDKKICTRKKEVGNLYPIVLNIKI